APQARLFVRCLQTSWQVATITWTSRESRQQFDDALRLLHAAETLREIDGAQSSGAVECYRRAAELFEWLARANDDVTLMAPISLYAGGAYQLGHLPAMATSLLKQPLDSHENSQLYGQFLRADFDAVLATCAQFWQRYPELTSRDGSSGLLSD